MFFFYFCLSCRYNNVFIHTHIGFSSSEGFDGQRLMLNIIYKVFFKVFFCVYFVVVPLNVSCFQFRLLLNNLKRRVIVPLSPGFTEIEIFLVAFLLKVWITK